MTFRELLDELQDMPDVRLDDTATVMVDDEFFAVYKVETPDTNVLDLGHRVITVHTNE